MSSQALSSTLKLFLSGYSLPGASGQCLEMGPALGHFAVGLQKGWSGISQVQWHLVGEGMALLAEINIAK